MLTLIQDLRYAFRQLWKDKTVAIVVIVTIALGIGVNTAVFSMLNGLDRPLPVDDPGQIVVLAADTKGDETGFRFTFSVAALKDIRRQSESIADVFASSVSLGGLSNGDKASQFLYADVSGNYFTALGVRPFLGRFFHPGEGETDGDEFNVILGHAFWLKRFAGDPNVIGRQVRIDGRPVTVIGVAPQNFHGTYHGLDFDGWMAFGSQVDQPYVRAKEYLTGREVRSQIVFARLKPGVTLEQAQASMTAAAKRMEEMYPDTDKGIGIRVVPERLARPVPLRLVSDAIPLIRYFLLILAALVLVLACMNVANVMLVRATVREREMAIRAALGSGRWRLIRQMLTESMLLALLGAAAGTVLGSWASRTLGRTLDLGTDLPILLDFSFDWHVFLYAMTAAVLTGVFVGMWPAVRASQARAGAALHEGGRSNSGGPARQRLRSLLVVGQVAGSFVLLIGAGLFVRSLQNAQRVDLGFAPDHLLNAHMNPHWAGYDIPRSKEFYKELLRRVNAWPEVKSTAMAYSVPLGYYQGGMEIYVEGRPQNPDEQPTVIGCNFIDGDYFETMQIPVLRGRTFRETDSETAPRVAIVNQTMANRLWPNEDPIGKRFHTRVPDGRLTEVVGVVKDGKYVALFEGSLPHFYVPSEQDFGPYRVLHIRATVPPETLVTKFRQEVHDLDPDMPLAEVHPMARALGGAHGFLIFRVGAMQASLLGLLGLVLAIVGIYGVVSYGAAQRTREIGIRMALGATPQSILKVILNQGVVLVITGIVVGLLGAAALTRLLARFLLLVSPTDPLTFIMVTLVLTLAALVACYIPARRATRIEPIVALRHE